MATTRPEGYMGIGQLTAPNTFFIRKFRFTFELRPKCPGLQPVDVWFVKTVSMPKYNFEETQLDFLNARAWIPGKITTDPLTLTYLGVAPNRPESSALMSYLNSVYKFTDPFRPMGGNLQDYGADGTLTRYDGCGNRIDEWEFTDLWAQDIDFGGEGDYSSSDIYDITLQMRYSEFTYFPICGQINSVSCCTGCNG